jgi:hypothetical protein
MAITEFITVTTQTNRAFLISGYVSPDPSAFTFPGVQVDSTYLTNANADFVVSYKGPIQPAKQDSITYEVDSAGQYLMLAGALQAQTSSTGTVKVFG